MKHSPEIPLVVPVSAYLRDHRADGRCVLPAAEALQILARTLPPVYDAHRQEGAQFSHLLFVDEAAARVEAVHEIEPLTGGGCHSRLTTRRTGRRTACARRIEHVCVYFPAARGTGTETGEAAASARAGAFRASGERGRDRDEEKRHDSAPFVVPVARLYGELVPFGPAWRNVTGEVRLTPAGAASALSGGRFPEADGPLGSPFPFDAAMHVACAWGQRYRGVVAFPVGFDRRDVLFPTSSNGRYVCRVSPLGDEGATLRFDIRIDDEERRTLEVIRGLRMRDISRGKRIPPAWVREGA
ncbi:MAG: polyketide synthase dehydratase domain-containing protein [Syntrophales bacterium]|nr:polyketide synthase dehydratase domain-containing protein [Syntrophales bacterium]